jgi:DNA-binding NarL/FixJ family response regulator
MEQHGIDILKKLISVSGTTILVVEDHPLFRDSLLVVLKAVFVQAIITTVTPETWLSVHGDITEKQYDLILLDGSLAFFPYHPTFEKFGMNLVPFIKEQSPHSCVIAISDKDSSNKIAMDKGADGFIPKESIHEFLSNLSA